MKTAAPALTRLFAPRNAPALALGFLCLHVCVWTLYATLSNTGALHQDMIEAYAWGREFQLGYYKHPPFWAWVAGAWFEVFPRANWAFYLLAVLNSGIAVLGVWQLAGLFARGLHRLNATLLILLIPFYTIQGHQFNANFMQLSLWPWTVYFFVLSMEKRRLRDAVLFGVLAAAGLLSKYYSALLLLSCFAASFWHPDWRRYYRSPAPYLAMAVCALLFAPHLRWLVNNDFAPFRYAEAKTAYSTGRIAGSILTFIAGCIGFNLLGLALIYFSKNNGGQSAGDAPVPAHYEQFLAMLALGPFFLTLLSAMAGHLRLSTNFAAPIFFLAPMLLIQIVKPRPAALSRLAVWAGAVLYAGAFLAAPAVPFLLTKLPHPEPKHALAVAKEAKRLWEKAAGPLRLRVAAGSEMYAEGIAFYSGEDTSAFVGFDPARSPWISPASLEKTGFLGLCDEADALCARQAAVYGGPGMREDRIRLAGEGFKPVSLLVYIKLPKGGDAANAGDQAPPFPAMSLDGSCRGAC